MMIYLDYSATTAAGADALAAFAEAAKCGGNANSAHFLGQEARQMIEQAGAELHSLLALQGRDVIYTSGATEANNLAIRGCFERCASMGKTHFITTQWEHPSVLAAINALSDRGASLDFAPTGPDGCVEEAGLKKLIRPDTLMVSIAAVSSELGIRQPVESIARWLKAEYPDVIFHSDLTQTVGKVPVDVNAPDLVSFSAHKFFGLKGIGALVKRSELILQPQIRGGSSTTRFRSGTPPTELIVSLAAALRAALQNSEEKLEQVAQMNCFLRKELCQRGFVINSPENAIPHILNVSHIGIPSDLFAHWMSEHGICLSTRTACASGAPVSMAVLALTGSRERAESSFRISISHRTTQQELTVFLSACDEFLREVKKA